MSDKLHENMPLAPAEKQGDAAFMAQALEQAQLAGQRGEVPVGAVLVSPAGEVLAQAGNSPVAGSDPTGHAEILVLRAGAQKLGNYRLTGCTLYVTLEPCPMCMSAIAMARLGRVVYAASDERLGACGGAGDELNLSRNKALNPHTQVEGGLLGERAVALLKEFFEARRPPRDERLARIAALEDIPNIDASLAAWLRKQGIEAPGGLAILADEAAFVGLLERLEVDCSKSSDERVGTGCKGSVEAKGRRMVLPGAGEEADVLKARLKAVRHFVSGGAAMPWRSFMRDDGQ